MTPAIPNPHRAKRWLLVVTLVVLAVPLLGYAALWGLVASDALRPRLIAAVEAATGRSFTLSGPVGVRLSLVPTITLDNPVLSNPPGHSRPEMVRARRIEAEIALIPLLSRQVQVRRLHLLAPDLLLEAGAAGPNWRLGPAARPEVVAPDPSPAAPTEPAKPLTLAVELVTIESGRVTWRGGAREEVVEIPTLTLRAPNPATGTRIEGRVTARGVTATVNAATDPLARLLRPDATPWAVRAGISAEGLNAEANGTLDLPFRPDGWRGRFAATTDGAARLAPFLPGIALPPARNLSLVAEAEGPSRLKALHVSVGEWPLVLGGRPVVLGPVAFSAASPEAAVEANGTVRIGDLPLTGTAQGPTLTALLAPGPRPFSVRLEGEGLGLSARGSLGEAGWPGTDLTATATAQDLAASGARLGQPGLPALHDATLETRLRALPDGLEIVAATLSAREAQMAGSGTWRTPAGALPRLTLRLGAERVDADALSARPAPAAPVELPPASAPAPPAPSTPAAPPAADRRVIPDRPVDLSALRTAPVAVEAEMAVRALRARGRDWGDVSLVVSLDSGRLRAERFAATTPGGRVAGTLVADATGNVPRLALTLRNEAGPVNPGPLLEAFGARPAVSGPATLDLSLQGTGTSTRALAASLGGHARLSMAGGQIDPRLIAGLTNAVRNLVPEGALGGATTLRCLALRFAFEEGIGRAESLAVQTGVVTATGSGTVNLRDETLALHLSPLVRIGGITLTVPLRIGGSFAAPAPAVESSGAASAAAAALGGLARRSGDEDAATLGALAESLAAGRDAAEAGCAAPRAATPGTAPRPRAPDVGDVLRGLLGR
ncbi:AsmA family protein [Muricoccus radiodurans]|uniref:AsmA family protein n=1 Tax=Muricoccus radiodurans TaxID=2231721 RepID=UPI003CE97B41